MKDIKVLESENFNLDIALTKACKMLDEVGYCCKKGHCNNLNSDCVECLRKYFKNVSFSEVVKLVKGK